MVESIYQALEQWHPLGHVEGMAEHLPSVPLQPIVCAREAGAPRPKSKREIRKEALAEAAASGLPDGWVEVTDDSGRVAFYGNVENCVETKHRARFLAVDETQFWG